MSSTLSGLPCGIPHGALTSFSVVMEKPVNAEWQLFGGTTAEQADEALTYAREAVTRAGMTHLKVGLDIRYEHEFTPPAPMSDRDPEILRTIKHYSVVAFVPVPEAEIERLCQ